MRHILLVEDEVAHAELVRRAFEPYADQFRLTLVGTLAEARRVIENEPPDLVLVDFLLPDGSGLTLLDDDPETRAWPVIVLTSHGSEQIAVEAMKAGALDYIVKSELSFADMPQIVRRSLREWGHVQERRRAERNLRESEEKFRQMLENASEGVLLVNRQGQITLINRYVEQVFGYSRAELLGQPAEMLVPEGLRNLHRDNREGYFNGPVVRVIGTGRELMARRADGTLFPVEIALSPINVAGEQMVMCFLVDISERKQLEEQRIYTRSLELELEKEREIIELKEQFTSMISHDFRTPLAIIASSVELMRQYFDRMTRESIFERLDGITEQVHISLRMLDDLMALNRANAGRLDFEPESVDLLALCRQVLANIELTDRGSHQLVFEVQQPPTWLTADRRLLEHALTNLLSNAIKYSPPHSRITFGVHYLACEFIIVIRDEGIGIPEEDHARLFQPFHRGRNARSISGTGLGLAIVRQNIEAHGGTITFVSAEGQGTTFIVRLPDDCG